MAAQWLLIRIAESPANRRTTAVVYLSGALDETSRPVLADCLRQFASKHADRLVVDLSEVTYLDNRSAATVLAVARAVLPDGVNPVIRNPPPIAQQTLQQCPQAGAWDLDISDDMHPALALTGKEATS